MQETKSLGHSHDLNLPESIKPFNRNLSITGKKKIVQGQFQAPESC